MIHFSFSSVLMTVFVSNLLLIAIYLLFRNEDIMARIGFRLTAMFCIITLLRFLFPFELPFTKTLALPVTLSDIISVLRRRYTIFPWLRVSVWTIFCLIWLVGSIYKLSALFYSYWKMRRLVRGNSKDVTKKEPYASILRELCTERQRRGIRLCTTKFVSAPMVMGLCNTLILLPADIDTSDADVMFALRHEIYHYVHHDLWLKFAVNCLVAAYWWNPFTHLLSKQIGVLLEMRVDDSIVSESEDAAIGYITSMIHYMGGKLEQDDLSAQYMGLALKKKSNLSRRFYMIQCKDQKRNYLLCTVILLLVACIYIGSYLVIFENSSYRQEFKESDVYTLPDDYDCFAIQNDDGTYTVYYPGWGISETVDSLGYYEGIKVYSSKEEYYEAIQNP